MTWQGGGGFPRNTRRIILARDGHRCTALQPDGTRCPATTRLEADHIISQAEAHRLGWTPAAMHHPSNGQTLCDYHHKQRTSAQGHAARPRLNREPEPHPGLH